jgi:membrane protease subunit (stomatin/prohibitin family)
MSASAPAAQPASYEDQTYIRLSNLKKLLDGGVISQEEFDKEKAKILNESAGGKSPE